MPSIYVLHRQGQLPTGEPEEGRIYPLLRRVGGGSDLSWAFAVPRGQSNSGLAERRKNHLIRAALRALGFELDPANGASGRPFDFFHIPEAADPPLVAPFASAVFDALTLPDLAGSGAELEILDPRDGAPDLRLVVGAVTAADVDPSARFRVDHLAFDRNSPGHVDLGPSGGATSPFFRAVVTPAEEARRAFPSGLAPRLEFDQANVDGVLRCNGISLIAGNSIPNAGDDSPTLANDIRHDRLTLDVATLVCLEPDTNPALAVELFPAISFQPIEDLPVTVSIANDGASVRLHPRLGVGQPVPPRLTLNRFKPCVRVTVRGPVIHADASTTGALRLLEPAERKFEDSFEQVNDFLVYSFEICLPTGEIENLTMPELLRLEAIGFDLPGWPNISGFEIGPFAEFLGRLTAGLVLPDVTIPNLRQLRVNLGPFRLDLPEPFAHLDLPDFGDLEAWKTRLRLRLPDGKLLDPLQIENVDLSGFVLVVDLSADIRLPDGVELTQVKVEFDYPRFRLPGVTFPEAGLPSLTEYDFPNFQVSGPNLRVEFPPLGEFVLPTEIELWTLRVKRPGPVEFEIPIRTITVAAPFVTFELDGVLPGLDGLDLRPGIDLLRIEWAIAFVKPSLDLNRLELPKSIPTVRLPAIDGPDGPTIDFRRLKLRARLDGVEIASYTISKILDFPAITAIQLVVPEIDGRFPDLGPLTLDGVVLDFALDLTLPLARCSLADLLGDLGSVDFRLSVPSLSTPRFDFEGIRAAFGSLATPIVPLELVVRVPNPALKPIEWDELTLVIGMRFDLSRFQLADNRIYFFLPQRRSFAPRQVVDFDIFTLTFPNRPEPLGFPVATDHDGYFDLNVHEFVIDLVYPPAELPEPAPRIHAYFPGGMLPEAARLGREGVDNLGKKDPNGQEVPNYSRFRQEYAKRFDLELDQVDPTLWPATGPDRLFFRFNQQGLTFAANLGKTEVEVDSSGFDDDGKADDSKSGLIKPFTFQPQEKLRELRSRLVVIDNELKEAGVYAKTEVPGVDNLIAEVSVILRQRKKGTLPDVLASMELERSDETPVAEFSIKLLEISLDRLELGLIWRREEKEWDYSIIVDGTIAFTGAAALVDDLEGLRAPSIQVIGLDLRRLNLREMRVPLSLVKPVRFEILDGMFGVELGDLELGWAFDGGIPRPTLIACELARLEFRNPGVLEVAVTVGGLHIEFDERLKAHVKLPSSLGIEVGLASTARFAGRVGWIETPTERYLFASGKLMLEGLPEIRGLLKFGTGLKLTGRQEINLVLYGEMDLDEQLFAGAVVKSLGVGIGLNNRLAAIPPAPSADAILRRIDLVKPGELEGWQFVREGGFYVSVIGSVTLASNLGDPDVLNAYIATLVVSFDSNLDIVAAGKCWLSCSLKGQRENPNNPAFVGAMVLSPRQRKLELVLESRPNPYIEQNDLMRRLLGKAKVRFAFRMTPQLVDFHLAEFSYNDQIFGVQMTIAGEYRFAIFKRAVLIKNELSATGVISRSLNAGPGGFDLFGMAALSVGYGGLLSDRGAMAYAFIDLGIRFRVTAWIEIGFSISFRVCGKRFTISWSVVFRTGVPQLDLTFRGFIAVADRGGLASVDCQVGINIVICGYPLRASGRLAVNPELYQEVRSQVAAFEAELEAAVKALDPEPEDAGLAAVPSALALVEQPHRLAAALSVPPGESWLLYTRSLGAEAFALLMPRQDARWLTPKLATVESIALERDDAVLRAIIPVPEGFGNLPVPSKVRLLGLRGDGVPAELDGTWPVLSRDATTLTLNVTGSGITHARDVSMNLDGGVWFAVESAPGLSDEDQETAPYLGEVERAVLPVSGWLTITEVDGATVTIPDHGITQDVRVVLRRGGEDGAIIDRGLARAFDNSDATLAPVTFVAARISANELEIRDLGGLALHEGWRLATALEIAPTWSARNRLAALRDGVPHGGFASIDVYREHAGAAAAWAETAARSGTNDPKPDGGPAFGVVFDERYASDDPGFTPPDAPVEPGVLSARFRPIEDVETVGAESVLEAARRFEQASAAVARQEIHGALDLDETESLLQARAQTAQLLVHRLSDPRGPQRGERLEAPVAGSPDDPSQICYGWFCAVSPEVLGRLSAGIGGANAEDGPRLIIRRAGEAATGVAVSLPDPAGERAVPEPLPIRQDFVVDDVSEVRERGRVIVKLPVRYPERVLRREPHKIGRLQVYRRVGSGDEELVADQLRPEISYLHRSQAYSRSLRLFVDEPVEFTNDHRFTGRFDRESRLLTVGREEARMLPASAETLVGYSCRSVAAGATRIEFARRDGGGNLELTLASADGLSAGPLTFVLVAGGLIVQRPVLISDEYSVTDREFESGILRDARGAGRTAEVRYSLRLQPEEDETGARPGERLDWENSVPIFIPARTPPPEQLALAVSVSSLLKSSQDSGSPDFVFQLVDLGGESPTLAQQGDRPLRADEFEFWLDGEILRQTGFYAGEADDPAPPREIDGERVTLGAVRTAEDIESTAGKIRVDAVPDQGGPDRYRLATADSPFAYTLRAGAGFRAFLRPNGDTTIRSLRRLPILLVREFPDTWDASVRYRIADTVEVIPEAHVEAIRMARAVPVLRDFSADDRHDTGRSAIRVVWPSETLLDGGVEIQFRDFDESTFRFRTLVEVLEAEEFARSARDFRDDTAWTPRPADRLERYASRVVASAGSLDQGLIKDVFLWKRFDHQIDAVRRLKASWTDPADRTRTLFDREQDLDWHVFAKAARSVQAALLSYEKSPLNLNLPTMRAQIELLRLALRASIVGNSVGFDPGGSGSPAEQLTIARSANQGLLQQLTEIEQSRAETVADAPPDDAGFLDRDTARKLAGIVRRRIAIANEAVSLGDLEGVPGVVNRAISTEPPLAREAQWQDILRDARSLAQRLGQTLKMTEALDRRFRQPQDPTHPAWPVTRALCSTLINRLIDGIEQLPLERLVQRAAGLSDLINRMELVLRGVRLGSPAAVLKRPHHELTTTRLEDGRIDARPVRLRELLPPVARQARPGTLPPEPDERLERLGVRAGHVATLSADGHVIVWTTRADSVHEAPMERLQHFVITPDHEAVEHASIAVHDFDDSPRLLIAADLVAGSGARTHVIQLWDAATARVVRQYTGGSQAVIAATPRGPEVAIVRGPQVHLETTDPIEDGRPPREPLQFFDSQAASSELDGPVAYHDEIRVLAAARGPEVLFWRDLGRSANDTPFRRVDLGGNTARATRIQPITLPAGAGFLVAVDGAEAALYFIDPLRTPPVLIPIGDEAGLVTDLAVDRRELTATAIVEGRVLTFDLKNSPPVVTRGPEVGSGVRLAVLHGRKSGRDESWLVRTSGAEVRITEASGEGPLQTLPAPAVLRDGRDVATAGEIVAIGTGLMTARSAVASVDVLSLFHLWERMGFAVDVAAQDATTRLLPLAELRMLVADAVRAMGAGTEVNGRAHHVYVVEGEEPDAEFRDDRVGFSHVKIAVVPAAFLAACLEPDLDALAIWFRERAIELATDGPEKAREFEHLVHATRLVGVPTADRFGVLHGTAQATGGVQRGGLLRVQPRSDRFVRVPASAGVSHWSWTLPDLKGHRILAAARSVSRYEPLLRWWLNLHTRFDLPEEVALNAHIDGGRMTIREVRNDPGAREHWVRAANRLNIPLPDATGWQPLRLEILEGTGAGQRRELLPFGADRTKLMLDPGDPWLEPAPEIGSICRVMDAAPGWRLVCIQAMHDPARGEGSRSLMVYQYPHSRRPRFSYQIPLDGMRATYNQISRVRTGYHGVEAAFRYALHDRIDSGAAPTLPMLLGAIIEPDGGDATIVPPDRTVTSIPEGPEQEVRLFRHERLVGLPGLPFFYRYRLDVRSAYRAIRLESDRTTAADHIPDDENASPPARRLPSRIGIYDVEAMYHSPLLEGILPAGQPPEGNRVLLEAGRADPLPGTGLLFRARPAAEAWGPRVVVQAWEDGLITLDRNYPTGKPQPDWEFELIPHEFAVSLIASANRDHLTREEAASEPNPVVVCYDSGHPVKVQARHLPDFFMEYTLNTLSTPGRGALPSLGDLFTFSGSVRLPWSTSFRVPEDVPTTLPRVTLSSGLIGRVDHAAVSASRCESAGPFLETVRAQFGLEADAPLTGLEIRALGPPGSLLLSTSNSSPPEPTAAGWIVVWDETHGTDQLSIAVKPRRDADAPGLSAVLARLPGRALASPELSVPLERVHANGTVLWRLRFHIAVGRGHRPLERPDALFVQGKRDGHGTPARPLQIVEG